jgi:hypothetical protein
MRKYIFLVALVLLSGYLFGSISSGYYNNPDFSLSALFKPGTFDMHHSLSFSSGFSSSGTAWYTNTYTNHLNFKLHENLDFKLNLNFVNDGSMRFNNNYDINFNDDNTSYIFPEFQIEWKPSDTTTFRLQFERTRFKSPWQSDLFPHEDPFDPANK